jgi:Nif-specific regulatory protein
MTQSTTVSRADQPLSPEPSRFNERLVPLLKICQSMNSERDLATLLDLIARETTSLMQADRASLFLLDREHGEIWSKVALGTDEILRFDARLGIAGAVASTGDTVRLEDARQDPRFYKEIDLHTGYRTTSLLAVPLRKHDGEIIGTFEALNKATGPFTAEDEEILKALAAQAAIAIESAQLIDQMKRFRDQLQEENAQLRKEVGGRFSTQPIVGASAKIQAVLKLIDQISNSPFHVLITGESGTGKDVAARTIHYKSARAQKPFIALNCAAIPESLVEAELFGIEKGVATGVERRIGKFEAANGGTLFLDEIGDLSLVAQAKLLRTLEEHAIERVGGRRAIAVDARILAATNKNLENEVKKGSFREDLYYRLKVIHLHMPSLREIKEDIPLLTNFLMTQYCRELNRPPLNLAPQALDAFMNYSWPGNVRELGNEVKRLALSVAESTVPEEALSEAIRTSAASAAPAPSGANLKDIVCDLERRLIQDTLKQCRQNQQRAATALGLSRQGLIKKMKRYRIKAAVE